MKVGAVRRANKKLQKAYKSADWLASLGEDNKNEKEIVAKISKHRYKPL
jgi:hypothetical protein